MARTFVQTAAVAAAWASVLAVSAATAPKVTTLGEPDPTTYTIGFSTYVAVDKNTVVVGGSNSQRNNSVPAEAVANVFVRSGSTWVHQQKLAASNPLYTVQVFGGASPGHAFGGEVAISGDTVVMGPAGSFGDPSTNGGSGSIYVFVRSGSTWSQQQRITAPDDVPDMSFGGGAAVSGDTLMASADGVSPRRIYFFVRKAGAWTLQQEIMAPVTAENGFGNSIAIDGDTALATSTGPLNTDPGSVYVFVRSGTTWSLQKQLTVADTTDATNYFGAFGAVLSGNTIVVHDSNYDQEDNAADYVFARSGATWTLQQRLPHPFYFLDSRRMTAVSGDTILIGTSKAAAASLGTVAVYVRTGASWALQTTLNAPDGLADTGFGGTIALSGATVVASEGQFADVAHEFVHVFDLAGSGGTNTPPAFVRPIVASPDHVVAGKPAKFSTLATDPDKGAKVSYLWHFGDNSTSNTKTKAAATKKYAAPGSYDVFATATDGKGGTVDSATATIVVEPAGTPYFDVVSASVSLNFVATGKDKIAFAGQFPLANGTALLGKVLSIDFGGVVVPFTLDAKGKSPKGAVSATVSAAKNGVAKFSVKMTGAYASLLADEGMTNAAVSNVNATTHVVVTFDGTAYSENHVMVYAAKSGKSGAAK